MSLNHDAHGPRRAPGKSARLGIPLFLLISTAAFDCPGPDPQADPGSGGGTSTTGPGSGGSGGQSVTMGAGGGGGCASTNDIMNCGACGRGCDPTNVINPSCENGVCTSFCAPGFVNIDRPEAPDPDDGCETAGHRVFVTSTVHAGDFGLNGGGPFQGDMRCQMLAGPNGMNLGGFWRAWVSDMVSAPAGWANHPTVPYMLLDGTIVADDWTDLTDGTIDNPIDISEQGTSVGAVQVWTGTTQAGNWDPEFHCFEWTSQALTGANGSAGSTDQSGLGWTTYAAPGCAGSLHLYCFEQ